MSKANQKVSGVREMDGFQDRKSSRAGGCVCVKSDNVYIVWGGNDFGSSWMGWSK